MPGMLDTLPPDVATQHPSIPLPVTQPAHWHLATRLAFRFTTLYFGLYVLTTQMLGGLLPFGFLPDLGATGWMKGVVRVAAKDIFHISTFVTTTTGSGDKIIDWVHAFCLLLFAAVGTAAWSAIDRKRPNYAALNTWVRVFLRFALGSTMVGYGMVKAIPLQMGAPSVQRLVEPYGNFSPMGVLWSSIGASFPYERFAGSMELLGAVLLFIPRLSLLGAMVTFATAVQIFTLNMTYDVPVKLFSFHLILISLALITPDARRLLNVMVLNKTAHPSTEIPLFRRRNLVRLAVALQIVFGGYILFTNYSSARESWTQFGGGAPKSPLYGIWNVEEMRVDGVVRSPLVSDYGRWRRLLFQNPAGVTFQRMDDSFQGYGAKVEPDGKTLALTNAADKNWTAKFTIDRPGNGDRMVLDGQMDGHTIRFDLRRVDHTKFLLLSRGFNWVQERPFNR